MYEVENEQKVVNFEQKVEEVQKVEEITPKHKTLANCKPVEFMKQTSRIRKSIEKWIIDTDFMTIRQDLPKLTPITNEMTDEEKKVIFEENRKATSKKLRENAMKILEKAIDEYAEETLEILGLCCFIEPEDVNNYTIDFYFNAFYELLSNKSVINFFTLLAQLGNMNTH